MNTEYTIAPLGPNLNTEHSEPKARTRKPKTDENPFAAPGPVQGPQGIQKILELVRDPESALGDISRLIALQIASIIARMDATADQQEHRSMRDLNDQVKALRELQRTLTESDVLSRRDTLNLDGAKFAFVFRSIVDFFRRALKEAGVDDSLAQGVMLQFSDMIKQNDETLRRDMNKIEAGK